MYDKCDVFLKKREFFENCLLEFFVFLSFMIGFIMFVFVLKYFILNVIVFFFFYNGNFFVSYGGNIVNDVICIFYDVYD